MASSQEYCEAIWMRKILIGLFGQQMDPTIIYCDNQSCIKLSENLVFHDRPKHIDIWYHHLRYCVQRRIMLLEYKGIVKMKIRVSQRKDQGSR